MKEVAWSVLSWCLLAAFVPCAKSATISSDSDRSKNLNVALRMRALYGMDIKRASVKLLAQHENRNMGITMSQRSDHPSGRRKRGCKLLTCSVHDLAYRISQLSNKMNNAPLHKISPCGYGRRRKRSVLQRSAASMLAECHLGHDSLQKPNQP